MMRVKVNSTWDFEAKRMRSMMSADRYMIIIENKDDSVKYKVGYYQNDHLTRTHPKLWVHRLMWSNDFEKAFEKVVELIKTNDILEN
jgi:hypothetical protein